MQKTKVKVKILIVVAVVAAALVLGLVLFKTTRLTRAINNMDIANKDSVTRVIKLCKNDADILCDIAAKYTSEQNPLGAAILMHILQNVDCQAARAKTLLKDYYTAVGADSIFISQIDMAVFLNTDFDSQTEFEGACYGGIDGIYCSDFDGCIRYKVSGARAKSMYACKDGVYFLDSADNSVKLLSQDGAKMTVCEINTSEFAYHGGFIYTIDTEKKINAPSPITLNEGEFGANIRVVGEDVLCDIFNDSYQLIDTVTLN